MPTSIDTSHDIPYLAGYSKDGNTIYIDRDVPRTFLQGKRRGDVHKYLIIHERREKDLMDSKGYNYPLAHQEALVAERKAVEADGFDWSVYNGFMEKWIKKIGDKRLRDVPEDLDLKPYHDSRDIETMKHIEQATSKRLETVQASTRTIPEFAYKNKKIAEEFLETISKIDPKGSHDLQKKFHELKQFAWALEEFLSAIAAHTEIAYISPSISKKIEAKASLYPLYAAKVKALLAFKGTVKIHAALMAPQFKTLFSTLAKDISDFDLYLKKNPAPTLQDVYESLSNYVKSLPGFEPETLYTKQAEGYQQKQGVLNKKSGVFVSFPALYRDDTVKIQVSPFYSDSMKKFVSATGIDTLDHIKTMVESAIKECESYSKNQKMKIRAAEAYLKEKGFKRESKSPDYASWTNASSNILVTIFTDHIAVKTPNRREEVSLTSGPFSPKMIENLIQIKAVKPLKDIPKGAKLSYESQKLLADYFAYSNLGGIADGTKIFKMLKTKGILHTVSAINRALDDMMQDVGSARGVQQEVMEWRKYIQTTPLEKIGKVHADVKPVILWLLSENLRGK